MPSALKQLASKLFSTPAEQQDASADLDDVQLAAAVLMVEVARADFSEDAVERRAVERPAVAIDVGADGGGALLVLVPARGCALAEDVAVAEGVDRLRLLRHEARERARVDDEHLRPLVARREHAVALAEVARPHRLRQAAVVGVGKALRVHRQPLRVAKQLDDPPRLLLRLGRQVLNLRLLWRNPYA